MYACACVCVCVCACVLVSGFLSRILATLYDLEVVEEKGVRDWLLPPDNRHPFLKIAKDNFEIKDNVEAKKQVC